jgi:hypothetical protein
MIDDLQCKVSDENNLTDLPLSRTQPQPMDPSFLLQVVLGSTN